MGTVPLVSLGYMCSHGWRDFKEYNPSGVKVWTKEYKHVPATMLADPRGGPMTSKHIDILWNTELLTDLLKIVSGDTKDMEKDRIFSNITTIGPKITKRIRAVLD